MANAKRGENAARISKMRKLSNSVSKRNARIHAAKSGGESKAKKSR